MKIVVTYQENDIKELIKKNLIENNINASSVEIRYKKGRAEVTVETDLVTTEAATESTVTSPVVPSIPSTPPVLVAVEGGAGEADMRDVLRQAKKNEDTSKGLYPAKKHSYLDGESDEPPGDRR